jgi:hypothetical protein
VTPAAAIGLIVLSQPASVTASEPKNSAELQTPSVTERRADLVVPVLHSLALMTVMRGVETVLWPQPFAEPQYFAGHYEEAYTQPPKFDSSQSFMRWDGDPLFINAVGHGVFGSELYLRARQCRLGWAGSLAFAAGASAVWEYGFEANGVRPSAQDLIYTPLAGFALGEARYAIHRLAGGLGSPAARQIIRAAVDPLGELERAGGSDC